MIEKTSDISLCITLPQHSWHEVDQINIIFGETILVVHNSSYMRGFSNRVEETTLFKMRKKSDINPCVLCDDVYEQLKNKEIDWSKEDVVKLINEIEAEIDRIMNVEF